VHRPSLTISPLSRYWCPRDQFFPQHHFLCPFLLGKVLALLLQATSMHVCCMHQPLSGGRTPCISSFLLATSPAFSSSRICPSPSISLHPADYSDFPSVLDVCISNPQIQSPRLSSLYASLPLRGTRPFFFFKATLARCLTQPSGSLRRRTPPFHTPPSYLDVSPRSAATRPKTLRFFLVSPSVTPRFEIPRCNSKRLDCWSAQAVPL